MGEEIRAASEAVARALAERLEDGSDQVWGLEELPRENRVSVQYFKRDALSLDFLGETYTALYEAMRVSGRPLLRCTIRPKRLRKR